MKYILPIDEISRSDMGRVGGKAYALAMMKQKGLNVPEAVTITTEAYNAFVDATGLRISGGKSFGTHPSGFGICL
jgi:phosphoenolpyruvate synthase/pyruvate phosphate dikinase